MYPNGVEPDGPRKISTCPPHPNFGPARLPDHTRPPLASASTRLLRSGRPRRRLARPPERSPLRSIARCSPALRLGKPLQIVARGSLEPALAPPVGTRVMRWRAKLFDDWHRCRPSQNLRSTRATPAAACTSSTWAHIARAQDDGPKYQPTPEPPLFSANPLGPTEPARRQANPAVEADGRSGPVRRSLPRSGGPMGGDRICRGIFIAGKYCAPRPTPAGFGPGSSTHGELDQIVAPHPTPSVPANPPQAAIWQPARQNASPTSAPTPPKV